MEKAKVGDLQAIHFITGRDGVEVTNMLSDHMGGWAVVQAMDPQVLAAALAAEFPEGYIVVYRVEHPEYVGTILAEAQS